MDPAPRTVRTLIDAAQVEARIAEMATQIVNEEGEPPILIGILNGAAPFMMSLLQAFPTPYAERVDWDFVDASSYDGDKSTGVVRIDRDPVIELSDRPILLVDGIVDTGRTIAAVLDRLKLLTSSSIRVVTLLDKPSRRVVSVPVHYRGFEIEDLFVVGYGMDWNQRYRSLRYIGVVED